jgi:hypothetical protein
MGHDFFWLIPIVAIIGGISVAITSIRAESRLRELRIRERIAMIEKGLVPPPEVDPQGFDRAMNRYDRSHSRARKHRSAGITLMGVGLGLMLLIGLVSDSPRTGFAVGGFLVIFGLTSLINSLFESRTPSSAQSADQTPQ